ncbi:uncharacterized protein Dvar_13430 [Desulfosarcina variabilis str. Montpellier]|uniref:hypothetical protein n=1 Tax=Desulfosarcina variabilis TaxID=2300 RepID=UPI003AFA029F
MKEKTQKDKTGLSKTKSSMSLQNEVICEDEACIGKDAAAENASNTDTMKTKHKSKKSPGTSMAIGGKVICNDDACIGED